MIRWLRARWARRGPPPLTAERRATLARLPYAAALDDALRERHELRVVEFLAGKRFYGCNGLEITDDMRVTIAGLASLLVLRPGARAYPGLRSILVYPAAFWVRHHEPMDAGGELGLVLEDEELRLGESQDWGRVVLSWEDVEAALAGDPVNVAVHEFAHQLDDENAGHEGAPSLPDYARWSQVMGAHYETLRERGSPVLDDYGAEGPSEFFAVATEAYFQSGRALRRHHPELHALLRDYYLVETTTVTFAQPPA